MKRPKEGRTKDAPPPKNRRRFVPPAPPAHPLIIHPECPVNLEMKDGSKFSGSLKSYGNRPHPRWINFAHYGKTIIYIRLAGGYGWITEDPLVQIAPPLIHLNNSVPSQIYLNFPNATFYAELTNFDRNSLRLFLPRYDVQNFVFITTTDGNAYKGYFKSK